MSSSGSLARRALIAAMSASATLVVLVAGTIPPLGAALAAPVPEGATWTQEWFPSRDGTMLRADVMLPSMRQATDRHPVILSIGPYFGRMALNGSIGNDGPVDRFGDMINGGEIFSRGYAYVQVDSRGFGGSDGCNDFGGAGEQMDVGAAVSWAATQPWSNGKVGMWGKSYDAWTQVMALAEDPVGLEAVVIQAPLIETYRGMFMNGVEYDGDWRTLAGQYAAGDLMPNTPSDPQVEEFIFPTHGTATGTACYAENLESTTHPDHGLPYWQERDIIERAGRSEVPTLWSHGMNDINTKPHNILPVWSRLKGPKHAWFGQWAHDRANDAALIGRDGFLVQALEFFDHYLKGLPLQNHPGAVIQDQEGRWRTEDAWPPTDACPTTFPIKPGEYTDMAASSAANPLGTWSVTGATPHDLRFAGEPRLSLEVDTVVPSANLVAVLYDVSPNGDARMLSRGAYRLPGDGAISFELYPQDAILRAGHRLAVNIAGNDSSHFLPIPTNTAVKVTKGSISIPFLRYHRDINLSGESAPAMGSVPVTTIAPETITANTVPGDFPPPPKPRPQPKADRPVVPCPRHLSGNLVVDPDRPIREPKGEKGFSGEGSHSGGSSYSGGSSDSVKRAVLSAGPGDPAGLATTGMTTTGFVVIALGLIAAGSLFLRGVVLRGYASGRASSPSMVPRVARSGRALAPERYDTSL